MEHPCSGAFAAGCLPALGGRVTREDGLSILSHEATQDKVQWK